jgi:CheY-like chemotaxis protein
VRRRSPEGRVSPIGVRGVDPTPTTRKNHMARQRPGISVLVVDDNEDIREAERILLEILGADVRTAQDGEEAWSLILADPPDLVLCDLGMPQLDGFGLVRRLRAENRLRRVVVIAVSGLRQPNLTVAREAGFDGHVAQPITQETLRSLFEHIRSMRESPSR